MSLFNNPPLIVVAGATAVGKTDMAIKIALRFDGEIVSADSMQVYRHLNIGTAKPSPQQLSLVPHHLIDCINLNEEFNAAIYVQKAQAIIADIAKRGKTIVVVGGTGLYIRALLGGLISAPAGNSELRDSYRKIVNDFGVPHLHAILRIKDQQSAQIISPNDFPRIMRALETIEITGKSIVALREEHRFVGNQQYNHILIGLSMDKEELFKRINMRVEQMIDNGWVDEVKSILTKSSHSQELHALRAVGYKHIIQYLDGNKTLEEAMRIIKQETRNYAKRQINWFSSQKNITWYTYNDVNAIMEKVESFITSKAVYATE
ncbi:MAG: tRNA (adenosine(37)-N6)-dimethylallyltransferase MiaA [Deltaproteobacteria bacterium]